MKTRVINREENKTKLFKKGTECTKVVDNQDYPHYCYREALVHKLCTVSKFLPKTTLVQIKDDKLTIKMELLEKRLKNPTDENKIKAWKNILQAVAVLNHFGIAHRDIKSENFMYRNGEEAVLIDFGLSKALGPILGFHSPNAVSEFYRAPEIDDTLETQQYGMEIDSWALGIWALELWNDDLDHEVFLANWMIEYQMLEYPGLMEWSTDTDEMLSRYNETLEMMEKEPVSNLVKKEEWIAMERKRFDMDMTTMKSLHNGNLHALGKKELDYDQVDPPTEEEWKQVNDARYNLYFDRVPESLIKFVRGFLLPSGQRKVATDFVTIESKKALFYVPDGMNVAVPRDYSDYEYLFKSLYWSIKNYFTKLSDKQIMPIAVLACNELICNVKHPEDIADEYDVDVEKLNRQMLEWFVQWSIVSHKK